MVIVLQQQQRQHCTIPSSGGIGTGGVCRSVKGVLWYYQSPGHWVHHRTTLHHHVALQFILWPTVRSPQPLRQFAAELLCDLLRIGVFIRCFWGKIFASASNTLSLCLCYLTPSQPSYYTHCGCCCLSRSAYNMQQED